MIQSPSPLLIGCAAGFSGDRVDAAGPVVDTLVGAAIASVERAAAFKPAKA